MKLKTKLYRVTAVFAGLLFLAGLVDARTPAADDVFTQQQLRLPIVERDNFTIILFSPLVVEGDIRGAVAVYDDPATPRPADYAELYDRRGRLLAFGWLDRFSIERIAVDRGLLNGAGELEEVFVVFTDGDAV